MSADHALQTAIRARLIATSAVTAQVPAASISDGNQTPAPDPSIVMSEGQSVDEGRIDRKVQRIYVDLHVWKKEPGLAGVKQIAAAVRLSMHASRLSMDGYHCGDCLVSTMRFMRDPDGETAHGVVTIEALVSEA